MNREKSHELDWCELFDVVSGIRLEIVVRLFRKDCFKVVSLVTICNKQHCITNRRFGEFEVTEIPTWNFDNVVVLAHVRCQCAIFASDNVHCVFVQTTRWIKVWTFFATFVCGDKFNVTYNSFEIGKITALITWLGWFGISKHVVKLIKVSRRLARLRFCQQ